MAISLITEYLKRVIIFLLCILSSPDKKNSDILMLRQATANKDM